MAQTRSKRYQEARKHVAGGRTKVEEAIKTIKQYPPTKFNESAAVVQKLPLKFFIGVIPAWFF